LWLLVAEKVGVDRSNATGRFEVTALRAGPVRHACSRANGRRRDASSALRPPAKATPTSRL
jgi:hypothetical protein